MPLLYLDNFIKTKSLYVQGVICRMLIGVVHEKQNLYLYCDYVHPCGDFLVSQYEYGKSNRRNFAVCPESGGRDESFVCSE